MRQIISLYSGADGLGYGAKLAKFESTIAIEKDFDSTRTIMLNNEECDVYHSTVKEIRSILPKRPFAIIGGPPCQDHSSANTQKTHDMTLVNEFWEIVDELKPKYYLMENVLGLYYKIKDKHPAMVLNCADYGVPQTRRRAFWTNIPLPKSTHNKNAKKLKKWVSVKEALGLSGERFISPTGFLDQNQKEITRRINEPAQTIVLGNEYQLTNYKIFSLKYLKQKKRYDSRSFFHELEKPSRTILGKDLGSQPSEMISDGIFARKLTNKELAILQGFPKDFKFYGGIVSVRKQIGNAVPPPIGKAFFEMVK